MRTAFVLHSSLSLCQRRWQHWLLTTIKSGTLVANKPRNYNSQHTETKRCMDPKPQTSCLHCQTSKGFLPLQLPLFSDSAPVRWTSPTWGDPSPPSLEAHVQNPRLPRLQIQNHLSEQAIHPRKPTHQHWISQRANPRWQCRGNSPRPRIVGLIKGVDALVDQSCRATHTNQLSTMARNTRRICKTRGRMDGRTETIRGSDQLFQGVVYFAVIVARENPHDTRHRPRIPGPVVRAADRVDGGAAHEVGVVGAQ